MGTLQSLMAELTPSWMLSPGGEETPAPPQEDGPSPNAPTWKPEIKEPAPDLMPDEIPHPNPDENREPAIQAATPPKPYPGPTPDPDPQPMPAPGPNPTPRPLPI